jgi:PAS domain S-box-containing protein
VEKNDLVNRLQKAGEELEVRVEERTAQLLKTNEQLMREAAERKRAEEDLRLEKQKFQTLAENAPFGMVMIGQDGSFQYVNPKFTELFGYNLNDVPDGRTWFRKAYPTPEHRHEVIATWIADAKLAKTGEQRPRTFSVRCSNGTQKIIHFRTVQLETGEHLMSCEDITERKRLEEERNRLFNLSIDMFCVTGFDGFLKQINPAWTRTLAWSEEELLTKPWIDFVHPDDREETAQAVEQLMSGRPLHSFHTRYQCKDGSYRWTSWSAFPLPDEKLAFAVARDITDRKKAEEDLRKSEEKYRKILETITDGYHEVDLAGNLTLANDSLCELFGYRRQELLGMNYRQLMDQQTAKQIYHLYNKVYRTGIANPGFEFGISRKDGSRRKVSVSVSLIRNEDGQATGFRGIFRDVTEKMRLEEQLRQAVKMEAIGRLAGSVAHDFNNILTAIIGYSGILMQQLPEGSPEHEKLLQIGRAAARAADLTRQLLVFSRKQLLDVEVMNLNEVIAELEKMLKRLIGEDIELVTLLNPSLGYVQADASQIEQILMNLAVNARDAMPNGGNLTIETADVFLDEDYCRVHPEVEPGQYVMFAVSDSGRGMDTETLSRCFDPFFTTKQKGAGTGLGLSTVYGIVKQHRGHITVYSEPGTGTIFKVYLPMAEAIREKPPKAPSVRLRPHGKETILIVEDESLVRNLTREALEMLGYLALTASDPLEAVALSDEHEGPIHLLLTDVVLPQMDGSTLFGKISSKRPEMKVLYMSGYTENFIVHHGVLDRSVHFIPKPFTVEALAAKIRRILDET